MKIALIPARSGSKRIGGKNIKPLAGHPLMAYTICAALQSGVFNRVLVSTDSAEYGSIAQTYGADVIMRPPEYATDVSPDIDWVKHVLNSPTVKGKYEIFSILRPTSPFRSVETIQHAMSLWLRLGENYDSLRAVEPCKQHPFKMWLQAGEMIHPFVDTLSMWRAGNAPPHSMPTQTFQRFYAQNASLEMAWSRVVLCDRPTISGTRVLPWTMPWPENQDVNTQEDLDYCRYLVETGKARLPDAT